MEHSSFELRCLLRDYLESLAQLFKAAFQKSDKLNFWSSPRFILLLYNLPACQRMQVLGCNPGRTH
jgi:hypothetical protein